MSFRWSQRSCCGLEPCLIQPITTCPYPSTEDLINLPQPSYFQVRRVDSTLEIGIDNNDISERLARILARRFKRIVYVSCSLQFTDAEEVTLRSTLLERLASFLAFSVCFENPHTIFWNLRQTNGMKRTKKRVLTHYCWIPAVMFPQSFWAYLRREND